MGTTRPRRYHSRSPTRLTTQDTKPSIQVQTQNIPRTQTLPLRRSEDVARPTNPERRQSSPMTTLRKPAVAQPLMPVLSSGVRIDPAEPQTVPLPAPTSTKAESRPSVPSQEKATTAPKPLLQDVSLYTNPHLSRHGENTSLEELAHFVRLSKFQERKRANTRTRLQRSLISTALSARLTRCGEIAHRNLVDSFRKDEKDNFAALYNAIHDVRKSCDELRRYALLEPDMQSFSSPALGSSESLDTPSTSTVGAGPLRPMTPFLNDISASARESFLEFLTQLRTNPDYLATRICSLSSSELNSLLNFHKGLEPVESVLPFHGRSAGRPHGLAPGRGGTLANTDIERLLSFQRHDPLSILIHTCFANSAGPDSSEDQRRTEIWATTCARLISTPKSTGEHFLISVLNIWTSMRAWSGKSSMEWYLMKIMEDGAFLLDRAEDQHGTRFNLSDWNQSDELAAKNFYDRAVDELFELIDDDDATGIPEGLLELGNAILRKLDNKYVENTSRWLVWRCLFFVFLLGVIIHPESYGMLADYHITPYAREKILKKVAMRAHEYVSTMWSGKPSATCVPTDIPPKIKTHIESILTRFQGSKSKVPVAKLLPARSITSLRETMEVHPYLLISPADLVTLVNALFPEKRPRSAASSFRSGPGSISGLSSLSQPMSMSNPKQAFDTASIISTSAGSVFSDATASRETVSDEAATPHRHSPTSGDMEAQRGLNNYEDDGYRLRLALHEMSQNLGAETLRGTCHPCAERWMVLFISANGKSLSTNMTYDPDDELEEDENSSSTSSDDEAESSGPDLDKDYHQLRDSILKLVEDFEIPQSLEPEGSHAQLSNRALRLKRYRSKNKIITTEKSMASRNPYRKHGQQDESVESPKDEPPSEPEAVLVTMLKSASSQSKAQADFVSSHVYWRTLNQLSALASQSLKGNGYAALINIFAKGPRDSIRRSAAAIEEYEAWLIWLKQSQERHEGLIDNMMKRVRAVRDKMWYVTDVRNSKVYAHSRDICQALKTMGMPRRWNSLQRLRSNTARGQNSAYLYRTESQIMDLLAASEEQGGPNKLSDDQAEMTLSWLQQNDVANFCQGEERIHRFCCEVDKCISKLVGENIRDAPVLWSSELYKRDKLIYDRMRARDRDQSMPSEDVNSLLSDADRRLGGRPPYGRDLRAMSNNNGSQFSIDSARYSIPRASAPLSEILDGAEYFGRTSPVHTLDSSSTFWSPFQETTSPGSGSRAYSPTTSLTNLSTTFSGHGHHLPSTSSMSMGRPGTSASSTETIFQNKMNDEKNRFLDELRQSLTSLLLSDLGMLAKGSETDAWFQNFGQHCIERKDALDRKAKRKSERREKDKDKLGRSSTRPRVIEKKKSFGNLRGAGETLSEKTLEANESRDTLVSETPSAASVLTSTMDNPAGFPFKRAYQRLLTMFCVHPNPYAKLNALQELENLITASLMSAGSKRGKWNRSDAGSSVVSEGIKARSFPLEGIIDSLKQRRSEAMQASLPRSDFAARVRSNNSEAKSILSGGAANSDAIANELYFLFKDMSVRPKALFRDLQLIASFVPSHILDKPERGKAFWNAGLAALRLKSEVCRTMMEMADEVVAADTQARKSTNEAFGMGTPSSTGTPPPPSSTYRLEDGGKMWAITAKEGFPTAQRELALFYLSRPEYVERTTQPLSKPREVFKQTVMETYGRNDRGRMAMATPNGSLGSMGGGFGGMSDGAAGGKEGDVRNDAGLMCVAFHWMEAAERGGDEVATTFLRQNELMAST